MAQAGGARASVRTKIEATANTDRRMMASPNAHGARKSSTTKRQPDRHLICVPNEGLERTLRGGLRPVDGQMHHHVARGPSARTSEFLPCAYDLVIVSQEI